MSQSILDVSTVLDRFDAVRKFSATICDPLSPEDCIVQSMPDVSPTRWHLAHTTWFFETFVLKPQSDDYQPVEPAFEYLFNSYYNTVGKQFPRHQRGNLSRPSVAEVWSYRKSIDERMHQLLENVDLDQDLQNVIEIGLQHEQQHQELMLTDIKHVLSCNPLYPVYRRQNEPAETRKAPTLRWSEVPEGIVEVGTDLARNQFAFDNESPRHKTFVHDHCLASRLVTNGEYLAFVQEGNYRRPEPWLSMGWGTVSDRQWKAPLFWVERDGEWHEFTLSGLQPLDLNQPVCHISYFEADAFARWSGCRLPTEFEWENSARDEIVGNFADNQRFHPQAAQTEQDSQTYGDVWEWTSSSYAAYPNYRPLDGALGEYNGKFMCNQYVLRGGSCATSQSHIRPTYRNFFPPDARWQFSGVRLCK